MLKGRHIIKNSDNNKYVNQLDIQKKNLHNGVEWLINNFN